MVAHYTIEFAGTYVEIRVSGIPDRDSSVKMWRDAANACRDNDCRKILGISMTERPIGLRDAIDYDSIFDEAGVTPEFRIAWVNENAAAEVMIRLIEEVLRNRKMVDARGFQDESEARRWLDEKD
ncbi:MAG: hypothetical protein QNJ14_08660 [Woeseiaceae bacterium]|nr:hypothetical protein [Woeseiaceae bacterium]